jgi:tetraacyldisaccharide 4'-kinase
LALREFEMRTGIKPVRRLVRPVVSIGNLSTGGAGKTPLAIALAKALAARGLHVDVLSRGYGRRSTRPLQVDSNGSAEEFGDEPLEIARESGVPVFVAADRYQAGLLAEAGSADSLIGLHLLDDGFQHRRLHRDVDILLLNRQDWHDRLLPAGNLREPLHAAHRATVIALPSEDSVLEADVLGWGWRGPVWRLKRRMEIAAIDGPVVAFCGIARSAQFFAGLQEAGVHLASRIAFADHHCYKAHDIDCILEAARTARAAAFVTTQKDHVRLGNLTASFPSSTPLIAAKLRIEIENADVTLDWLMGRLGPSLKP